MRNIHLPQLRAEAGNRYEPLGAFGTPVHHQYNRIRSLLLTRRRVDLANYFARPVEDVQTGEIRWMSEIDGQPRRYEDLSTDEARRLASRLASIQHDLASLADELRRMPATSSQAGGTGPAFAAVLDFAQRVPECDDFLYFVGEQPIITCWGFRDEHGQSHIPSPRMAAPKAVSAVAQVASTQDDPAPLKSVSKFPSSALIGLLVLFLTLLLAALAWWWLSNREGQSVSGQSAPAAPLTLPADLPATRGRKAEAPIALDAAALARGDLSFLAGLWQFGEGRVELYSGSTSNIVGSARAVLEFDRNGQGRRHRLEVMRHGPNEDDGPEGPSCSGSLNSKAVDGKLLIELDRCQVAGSDEPKSKGESIECTITPNGKTECMVNNLDGHKWAVELLRIR